MHQFRYDAHRINIAGLTAVEELFRPIFFDRSVELVLVAFIDAYWVLQEVLVFPGTCGHAEVSLRKIVGKAVALEAHGIVMAHNHPSGDCTPSRSDKILTRAIAISLEALDVVVLDHVVFGPHEVFSMRQAGLL